LGIEDIRLGATSLTVRAEYQGTATGDRLTTGADVQYYLLPLGFYGNIAPLIGYRYLQSDDYSTQGVNVGVKLVLALSRTGAADMVLTQSFVAPGSGEEVGITSLTVGYAVTKNLRIAADLAIQNSPESKDGRVGIIWEWLP
jgi:hypothetical protein